MPNYQGVWSVSTQFQAKGDGNWPANYVAPVGLFGGGKTGTRSNVIQFIEIASLGNSTDFGDLTVARRRIIGACSSATRGVFGGGNVSGNTQTNVMDYVTIASTGNATDFGNLTLAREFASGAGNSTRGVFLGGYGSSVTNTIDYITIASTGNASDFGNLTSAKQKGAAMASSTRALYGGGLNAASNGPDPGVIDYITIASTGNASDFGDMGTPTQYFGHSLGACSSATRGLFMGGTNRQDIIDFVTIASTGNATDFGDLYANANNNSCCSSNTRGITGGGDNVIQYVTIATTGNSQDFGDMLANEEYYASCSNAHGGLS